MSVPRNLADWLEYYRVEKRRSVADLAALSGVPLRTIENWFAGRTRRPRVVADLLHVAAAFPLSEEETNTLLGAGDTRTGVWPGPPRYGHRPQQPGCAAGEQGRLRWGACTL